MWQDSNLHRVWDTGLVEHQNLSYTEWKHKLVRKLVADDVSQWHSTTPADWISESTKIRDTAYPEDTNNLSWQYVYKHNPDIELRLTQGGVRIALYLNQLFNELAK